GEGFRLAGNDRPDAGVGMGAAEDLAMQQSWHVHVSTVSGVARDLVQAVVAEGPRPHHIELAWARALFTRCARHTFSLLDQMSVVLHTHETAFVKRQYVPPSITFASFVPLRSV